MRIKMNKTCLTPQSKLELDNFNRVYGHLINGGGVKWKYVCAIEVCVCENCGAELYAEWKYYEGDLNLNHHCFNRTPEDEAAMTKHGILNGLREMRYEEDREFHKSTICPVCGAEISYVDGISTDNLDSGFSRWYAREEQIRKSRNQRESLYDCRFIVDEEQVDAFNYVESVVKEYENNVYTTPHTGESNLIRENTEKLKEYLLNILQTETNIESLKRRLAVLYFRKIFNDRDTQRAKNKAFYEPKYKKQEEDKKYAADHDRLERQYKNLLSQLSKLECSGPEPIPYLATRPSPVKPCQPELKQPGFFNKKKVLGENAVLTAQYEESLRKYEADVKAYDEEQEYIRKRKIELTEIARQDHERNMQNCKSEIQSVKEKLENHKNQYSDEVDATVTKATPEEVEQKMIATEINNTSLLLKELIECRSKLYSYGIVFGKYRDIVAIATFCEYLMSGRCTSLEGTNGAYNMYEAEVRANMIISQLSEVISSLDEIKKNQYMIYSQLKSIQNSIENLNSTMEFACNELRKISSNTSDLNEHMAIVAQNSKVIAHNTAVSAYYAKVNAELTNALGFMVALK